MRRANRNFRYHPEASENFLMHFLILPSSLFLSQPGTDHIVRPKEVLHLLRTDPDTINQCLLHLSAIKGIHHGFEEEVSQLKDKATKLRQQIIAAYHV